MTQRREFYVYEHRRLDTGGAFYVGKGSGRRAWSDLNRNRHWRAIVKKSGGFSVHLLAENLAEHWALDFECAIIEAYGRERLANLTAGGEGLSGYTFTAEHRAKIGAKHRGRTISAEQRAAVSASRKGCSLSAEHRAKLGDANRGRKHSEETKAKIRAAQALRPPASEETRAKIGAASRGRHPSEEARSKMREAQLKRPPISDETRAKIGAKHRGKIVSPETREKLRAAALRRHVGTAIVTPEMLA